MVTLADLSWLDRDLATRICTSCAPIGHFPATAFWQLHLNLGRYTHGLFWKGMLMNEASSTDLHCEFILVGWSFYVLIMTTTYATNCYGLWKMWYPEKVLSFDAHLDGQARGF